LEPGPRCEHGGDGEQDRLGQLELSIEAAALGPLGLGHLEVVQAVGLAFGDVVASPVGRGVG
jgi:hypothetical protein